MCTHECVHGRRMEWRLWMNEMERGAFRITRGWKRRERDGCSDRGAKSCQSEVEGLCQFGTSPFQLRESWHWF